MYSYLGNHHQLQKCLTQFQKENRRDSIIITHVHLQNQPRIKEKCKNIHYSGHSQGTYQFDERINVRFPKKPQKRRRKERIWSVKENKENSVWHWADSPKAQRGNCQNYISQRVCKQRKILKSGFFQPFQETRKVDQAKRVNLQRKLDQKLNC